MNRISTDALNKIELDLAGAHAAADVLSMLAAQADLETLHRGSLTAQLIELEQRLGALRSFVREAAK
jgi:hypothetical protein